MHRLCIHLFISLKQKLGNVVLHGDIVRYRRLIQRPQQLTQHVTGQFVIFQRQFVLTRQPADVTKHPGHVLAFHPEIHVCFIHHATYIVDVTGHRCKKNENQLSFYSSYVGHILHFITPFIWILLYLNKVAEKIRNFIVIIIIRLLYGRTISNRSIYFFC